MGLRDKLNRVRREYSLYGLWWLAVMLGVFLIVLVLGHGPELPLSVILPPWAPTLLAASPNCRRFTHFSIGTACGRCALLLYLREKTLAKPRRLSREACRRRLG